MIIGVDGPLCDFEAAGGNYCRSDLTDRPGGGDRPLLVAHLAPRLPLPTSRLYVSAAKMNSMLESWAAPSKVLLENILGLAEGGSPAPRLDVDEGGELATRDTPV